MADSPHTVVPALLSGAVQAVIFNPIDKALYLRVRNKRRSFLDRRNFEKPFQSFGNAIVYRTVASAMYFIFQGTSQRELATRAAAEGQNPGIFSWLLLHPTLWSFSVGFASGLCNGLTLNSLQAVKFYMWAQPYRSSSPPDFLAGTEKPVTSRRGFVVTAAHMYETGGVRIFFRGVKVTIARDAVFGVTYEVIRNAEVLRRQVGRVHMWSIGALHRVAPRWMSPQDTEMRRAEAQLSFALNMLAAMVGTVASAPINYLRTAIYGSDSRAQSLSATKLAWFAVLEVRYVLRNGISYFQEVSLVIPPKRKRLPPRRDGLHWKAAWQFANSKLNLGWGSLRVGLGIAVGQHLFTAFQQVLV